tara:strand:- start:1693 stop:2628 length:936 start_codon:yes stop_codon:yes gene_type:complete
MTQEIKETITKGQAMDIADAQKFNADVESVNVDGGKPWNKNDGYKPVKEYTLQDGLDFLNFDVNGIYGYGSSVFKQRLYLTTDRHLGGISLTGYASRDKENRRDREQANFSIYFDNKEQIIQLAQQCLNMLLVAEESGEIARRYKDNWLDGKHPDVLAHFPSLLDKTRCETGRYYWDGSTNKVVEITKDTPQEILDAHDSYDVDEDGKFEPDYANERAEDILEGLLAGMDNNWETERWQGIRLADLQTGMGASRYNSDGISQHKGRNPEDKRRKQWTTTFKYTDGTSETLVGYWNITRGGTLQRNTWKEEN